MTRIFRRERNLRKNVQLSIFTAVNEAQEGLWTQVGGAAQTPWQ